MFQEDFRNAAIIVQNIVNTPSSMPNTDNDITQLGAALSFNQDGAPSAYLSRAMQGLTLYLEPADRLMRDLETLYDDLSY